MPGVFKCPSFPQGAPDATLYQVLIGPGTLFDRPEGTRPASVPTRRMGKFKSEPLKGRWNHRLVSTFHLGKGFGSNGSEHGVSRLSS